MKILVVDDMISIRHVLIHMLKDIGYHNIDEAGDGRQALKMLNKTRYDLLISDYNMPKLDGLQLLDRLRKSQTYANLPVFIVSCEHSKEKIHQLRHYNISGFIIKPFCTNTLKKQLNRLKSTSSQQSQFQIALD